MHNTILITGAYGFVGSNISKFIKNRKDYFLVGLDQAVLPNQYYNECYSWDNLQKVDWGRLNTIIHLAGKAHDTSNTSDPQSYFTVNLDLTKIIFDYFLKSNADKFIFFSSVKAVADTVQAQLLTEDVIPNPLTPYGKSKLAAENYILSKNIPENKKVYILRPCMIHGPGNKGNLNLLYKMVQKGIPYPLGRYDNLRSFTSIENLIYIIHELIENIIQPGTYLVGDDNPVSTNELIELIAKSLNNKPRIWNIPPKLIRAIAASGDILNFPLNSERLKKLTESYVVSNVKIKSAIGINNLPVSAKDGLLKTFGSFLN